MRGPCRPRAVFPSFGSSFPSGSALLAAVTGILLVYSSFSCSQSDTATESAVDSPTLSEAQALKVAYTYLMDLTWGSRLDQALVGFDINGRAHAEARAVHEAYFQALDEMPSSQRLAAPPLPPTPLISLVYGNTEVIKVPAAGLKRFVEYSDDGRWTVSTGRYGDWFVDDVTAQVLPADKYALEALERFSPGVPPGSQDEMLLLLAYDKVTADLVESLPLLLASWAPLVAIEWDGSMLDFENVLTVELERLRILRAVFGEFEVPPKARRYARLVCQTFEAADRSLASLDSAVLEVFGASSSEALKQDAFRERLGSLYRSSIDSLGEAVSSLDEAFDEIALIHDYVASKRGELARPRPTPNLVERARADGYLARVQCV